MRRKEVVAHLVRAQADGGPSHAVVVLVNLKHAQIGGPAVVRAAAEVVARVTARLNRHDVVLLEETRAAGQAYLAVRALDAGHLDRPIARRRRRRGRRRRGRRRGRRRRAEMERWAAEAKRAGPWHRLEEEARGHASRGVAVRLRSANVHGSVGVIGKETPRAEAVAARVGGERRRVEHRRGGEPGAAASEAAVSRIVERLV